MIINILSNTNPTSYEGASHKETFSTIGRQELEAQLSFNLCDYQCAYTEPKFSESGAIVDAYKNDKSDHLVQLSLTSDTAVFKIFKCEDGGEVEKATISDNTYGLYYDKSFFPDSLKYGFVADWNIIYNTFGPGKYLIKADIVIIGVANTVSSWIYELQLFSEEAANDTIKIQTTKTGCIEGGIDYSGFVWESEIRLNGTFGRPTLTLEKDHYQTQDRKDVQIKDGIITNYTMQTELVPFEAIRKFLYDDLLANNTFITSYEIFGFLSPYVSYNVVAEEIDDPTYYERNTSGTFTISFTDKFNRPVKTNK